MDPLKLAVMEPIGGEEVRQEPEVMPCWDIANAWTVSLNPDLLPCKWQQGQAWEDPVCADFRWTMPPGAAVRMERVA